MATEPLKEKEPRQPKPGRLVIEYLQDKSHGATARELLRYLRSILDCDESELKQIVDTVLVNGTALGFLERSGSYYEDWSVRDKCRRRRRRSRHVGRRACGQLRRRRRRRR